MTREDMINGVKSMATLRWVKADGELPRLIRIENNEYISRELVILEKEGIYAIGQYIVRLSEDGSVKEYGLDSDSWKGLRKTSDFIAWAELPLIPGLDEEEAHQ